MSTWLANESLSKYSSNYSMFVKSIFTADLNIDFRSLTS